MYAKDLITKIAENSATVCAINGKKIYDQEENTKATNENIMQTIGCKKKF